MKHRMRTPLHYKKPGRQTGSIFFMLFASIALIGALTVTAGNTVKGIVTSMSDVTRKSIAEEKMQGAARLSIMNATSVQANSGDCDSDGFVEPLPYVDAGTGLHPVGGGYVPADIGAETRDPWGTQYGYCAWDVGTTMAAGCGGGTAKRLAGGSDATGTVVAVISAGKDRKFSTTCNTGGGGGVDVTSGLIGHWNLDETTGTNIVDSAGGHNGTADASVTSAAGKIGTAITFGGSEDEIIINDSAFDNLTNMTVCAWIKSPIATSRQAMIIVAKSNDGYSEAWQFYTEANGKISFYNRQRDAFWSATGIIQDNTWHHVCATWDGGGTSTSSKVYADGTPLTMNYGDYGGLEDDSSYDLSIGSSANGTWDFEGQIDDVRIYNRVLSDAEVTQVMNAAGSGGGGGAVTRASGSDDIVLQYTYNDANGLSGDDLWQVKDTEPGKAKIDKNIEVAGGADLAGPLMAKGLLLPEDPGDDSVTGACNAAGDQQLRLNVGGNPVVLEICDYTGGNGWTAVSMGAGDGGPTAPTAGMIANWKLDETTGDEMIDSSSTNNSGWWEDDENNSVAEETGTGADGKALTFDWDDDVIWVPYNATQTLNDTKGTVSGWVKPYDNVGQDARWMIYRQPRMGNPANNEGLYFGMYQYGPDDPMYPTVRFGTQEVRDFSTPIPQDKWSLVTLTWNGSTAKMYVNSVLTKTFTKTGSIIVDNDDPDRWIGINYYAGVWTSTPGAMDDIRLYDRDLSSDEVTQLYVATGGTISSGGDVTTNLTNRWKFDNTNSDVPDDIGGQDMYLTGWYDSNHPGRIGRSTWFSGVDAVAWLDPTADIPIYDGGAYSYSIWINPDATQTGGEKNLFWFHDNSGGFEGITLQAGDKLEFFSKLGWPDVWLFKDTVGGVVPWGSGWHHVVATVDWGQATAADRVHIYVDGALVDDNSSVNFTGPYTGFDAIQGAVGREYTGELDELRMYNRVLTAAEVTKLYNYGNGGGGQPADCSEKSVKYFNDASSGHCYYTVEGGHNFAESKNDCQASGGYLAVITSAEEDAAIQSHSNVLDDGPFIDGTDAASEGVWKYTIGALAGTQFWQGDENGAATGGAYTNWEAGEPDDGASANCVAYWSPGNKWHDFDCADQNHTGLCEISGSPLEAGTDKDNGSTGSTDGLVLYLPFESEEDAKTDYSPVHNTMAWGLGGDDNEFYFGPGKIGGGAVSDNSPDGISIADNPALNTSSFTLSAWIKPAWDTGVTQQIINKWDDGWHTPYWFIVTDTDTLECGYSHDNASDWDSAVTTEKIAFGTWTYATCTYDQASGDLKIYINGVVKASENMGAGVTPDSNSEAIWIGWNETASGEPYVGNMDEIRIYNRALDPSEITDLYNDTHGIDSYQGTTFLKTDRTANCTNATAGPAVYVGDAIGVTGYNRVLWQTPGDDYLYSGGYNTGLAVYSHGMDGRPTELARTSDNGMDSIGDIYINSGNIFTASGYDNVAVSNFDGSDFFVNATVDPPGENWGITGDGRYIYISGADPDAVMAYTYDGSNFTLVDTWEAGGPVYQLWSDGAYIYVAESTNGFTILKFDGTKFSVVAHDKPDPNNWVDSSYGDGKYLYVDSTYGLFAYSFDGTNLNELAYYFHQDPIGNISGDGTNLFVSFKGTPKLLDILRFNGKYFISYGSIPIPDDEGYAVSDGNYIYVGSNSGDLQVYSGFSCYAGTQAPESTVVAVDKYRGKLAIGDLFSCGIKPDGSAWCWGNDGNGRLGNGSTITTDQTSPSRVQDAAAYTQITAGDTFACGIRSDGSAWCWGSDAKGQIGNGGTTGNQTSPSPVSGGYQWTQISAGTSYACGLRSTGDLYCWGLGDTGQLGTGSTPAAQTSPAVVSGSYKWAAVSAGDDHTCGIQINGTAWCWGDGSNGDLGNGDTGPETVPVMVRDAGPWVNISAGNDQTCGVKLDGSAWCWGWIDTGQLGIGEDSDDILWIPVKVADPGPWVEVFADRTDSGSTTCGIKLDGTAWCWGEEVNSALGNGSTTGTMYLPDKVVDPGPWATIRVANGHTCGLKTDGSAWCWGSDSNGQIGNAGTTGNQASPVHVANFPSATPWQWDDTGVAATASGTANISMGTTSGISYDGSVGASNNGLVFSGAGQSVLRQNTGGSELLIETTKASASSQISWKTAAGPYARSMGIDYATGSLEIGANITAVTNWMQAISPQMEITAAGNVGIGTSGTVYSKLQINGGLKVGTDSTNTCTVFRAGTLIYTGSAVPFSYCNGTVWLP